jgi:hypothetical protein
MAAFLAAAAAESSSLVMIPALSDATSGGREATPCAVMTMVGASPFPDGANVGLTGWTIPVRASLGKYTLYM